MQKGISRIKPVLLIFCISILSCNEISERLGFSQPEIVSVYPSNNMPDVPVDARVIVQFSKDMDRTKCNDEFSLSSQRGRVDGFFSWSDNRTMVFQPKELLTGSNEYTIAVSSSAEDSEGNDLVEDYVSVFYINRDLRSPAVTGFELSYIDGNETDDRTNVSPDTYITVNFTEAIDLNSIYDGFSISPSVKGMFQWNAGQTSITFMPLNYLDFGTNYTVVLSENIRDVNGNSLSEQYSFNFTVGNDFEKPVILSVRQDPLGATPDAGLYQLNDPWDESRLNYCIEKQNDIVITFSEPVMNGELYSSVTISPSAQFYISFDADDTIRLVFTEAMKSEEYYTLNISSSITDLQENPLDRDYEFDFYTNSVNSIQPVVEYITDSVHYDDAGFAFPGDWAYPAPAGAVWSFGEIEPLSLNPLTPDQYQDIYIIFSNDMVRTSISVDISHVAGSATTDYMITNPDWSAYTPGNMRVYMIDIENISAGNVYRITIQGGKNGARDINDNYMEEDFVQYIRF